MSVTALIIMFGVSTCLALYPFLLYPGILWLRTRRICPHGRGDGLPLPSFSVIIPCHNEEKVIARKIANTLECAERTEVPFAVIVVSDASNDATCEIARLFGSRIRLIELTEHSGILGAFKAGLETAIGEVVVFSDADIVLDPDALRMLLSHYADPKVGGVCGFTAMEIQPGSGLNAEQLHIGLRGFIRQRQSNLHSIIGPDGSNWSMRRCLIRFPSKTVIADDLVLPLELLRGGYRYIFERQARALETSAPSIEHEFRRRVRTIAGGMQAAIYCRWMFSREHRCVGFHFISSKIAKHATILWVAVAGTSVVLLAPHSAFFARLAVIFYAAGALIAACGLIRTVLRDNTPRPVNAIWHLFLAFLAPILAIRYLVKHGDTGIWAMTPRASISRSEKSSVQFAATPSKATKELH